MHPLLKTRPCPKMVDGLAATAGGCALCKYTHAIPTTGSYLTNCDIGNVIFSPNDVDFIFNPHEDVSRTDPFHFPITPTTIEAYPFHPKPVLRPAFYPYGGRVTGSMPIAL
jgi:hypothetical protein